MNRAVMGDRTVRADDCRAIGDMDHGEVLDVRERTNFDVLRLSPHDYLGPN